MTTSRELITGALRLINVVSTNETPLDDDMQISLDALNAIIDEWSTQRLSIYTIKPYYLQLRGSGKTYSVGPGGDLDVERPMNIEEATTSLTGALVDGEYISDPDTLDLPLTQINDAQYASFNMKQMTAMYPSHIYNSGDYPINYVSFWPVPLVDQVATLWLWEPLPDLADLDAELNLPKGFERALRFQLAIEVAPEFGKAIPDSVQRIAIEAFGVVKRLDSMHGIEMSGSPELGTAPWAQPTFYTGGSQPR